MSPRRTHSRRVLREDVYPDGLHEGVEYLLTPHEWSVVDHYGITPALFVYLGNLGSRRRLLKEHGVDEKVQGRTGCGPHSIVHKELGPDLAEMVIGFVLEGMTAERALGSALLVCGVNIDPAPSGS